MHESLLSNSRKHHPLWRLPGHHEKKSNFLQNLSKDQLWLTVTLLLALIFLWQNKQKDLKKQSRAKASSKGPRLGRRCTCFYLHSSTSHPPLIRSECWAPVTGRMRSRRSGVRRWGWGIPHRPLWPNVRVGLQENENKKKCCDKVWNWASETFIFHIVWNILKLEYDERGITTHNHSSYFVTNG